MKTNWVATIETEKGTTMVGIKKIDNQMFEIIGKLPDGTIESTEQSDETYAIALESISMMYFGEPWNLQWIEKA